MCERSIIIAWRVGGLSKRATDMKEGLHFTYLRNAGDSAQEDLDVCVPAVGELQVLALNLLVEGSGSEVDGLQTVEEAPQALNPSL
eukprot:3542787-Pleurochrysis_carterae.AAC.4